MIRPQILIIGHARHGKDTVAEMLHTEFGMKFESSSMAAARIFLFDKLNSLGHEYTTVEECFEDRVNHRELWFNEIKAYNTPDPTRLARDIMSTNDCYVGMRSRHEIEACLQQRVFNLVIWVDAQERLPLESSDSFDIDPSCADIIIPNNTTIIDLFRKVNRLGAILFPPPISKGPFAGGWKHDIGTTTIAVDDQELPWYFIFSPEGAIIRALSGREVRPNWFEVTSPVKRDYVKRFAAPWLRLKLPLEEVMPFIGASTVKEIRSMRFAGSSLLERFAETVIRDKQAKQQIDEEE